jgi:hypothetical protein
MDQIFVVCQVATEGSPVRKRADEVFKYIVKPAAETKALAATRSDQDPTPGQVTAQIIRSLTSARVVVADLTGKNSNVYYELAVAHAFAVPVIILVNIASELSFDMSTERVIEIGDTAPLGVEQVNKAKQRLEESLTVVLDPTYTPRSLISEAAGSQSLRDLAPDNPIATELAFVRESLDDLIAQSGDREGGRALHWERDAAALWRFIRDASEEGKLTTADLEGLAEAITSPRLRTALDRQATTLKDAESHNDGLADPFA